MSVKAFQDSYPDELSYCYGCGRLNPHGLQLKSTWDGDESVAVFEPKPFHTAIPGFVYGGLIASLIDCHGTGTASAAAHRAAGGPAGSKLPPRFVTGSLQVRYVKPTPLGVPLKLRAVVTELKPRKVTLKVTLSAKGIVCATGEVIAVRMPDHMVEESRGESTR